MRHVVLFWIFFCFCLVAPQAGADNGLTDDAKPLSAPDGDLAQQLFETSRPLTVLREDAAVPGWSVRDGDRLLGYIGSTWELAESTGYSGRPLDVLVAISSDAKIAGAKLMLHNEPVLTLGISDADISRYVDGFRGVDLTARRQDMLTPQPDLPDVIARATVSTGVIRDGILRSARSLAMGRGLISGGSGIDRVNYKPATWSELLALGGLTHARLGMDEAAKQLSGAVVPISPGSGAFIDIYAGLADPPIVGRNLLGQKTYNQVMAALGPGESALLIMSSGLHSHRGTAWKQTGQFDRLAIVQGEVRHIPQADDYVFVTELELAEAPSANEISIFRLPKAIDPAKPMTIEVSARRPAAAGGEVTANVAVAYSLPESLRLAPPPAPEPLWHSIWASKHLEIGIVSAMLAILTLILFAQDSITKRPRLWRGLRIGFLSFTLVVLGWGLNGQLSVVQVVAFIHSLLTHFRWETFLIEPVIFLLWSFVALGLLFWGRGVYCGWLCPFGALQELTNMLAQRLGVKQIAVPQALHERLWVIKYSLFIGILALSFYAMRDALILAEAEPFKTAISLRMIRPWPFVAFVLALLFAGLFIERFYCRYLCPLGAGLAIPAKLKVFDWLKRRPQCGRECRLCETKCTVGAIDPLGRINANECVLCLRCQVIMDDSAICPVLRRRARVAEGIAP